MPSPICTIDGYSTINGYYSYNNSPITIALRDATGVNSWDLTCIGTDNSLNVTSVNNDDIVIDDLTKTAVLTVTCDPSHGGAYLIRSVVNDGLDSFGQTKQDYTTTFGIFVSTDISRFLISTNQSTEGSAYYGWIVNFNRILENDFFVKNTNTRNIYNTTGTLTGSSIVTFDSTKFNTFVGGLELNTTSIELTLPNYELSDVNKNTVIFVNSCEDPAVELILPTVSLGRVLIIVNNTADGFEIVDKNSLAVHTIAANRAVTLLGNNSDWSFMANNF